MLVLYNLISAAALVIGGWLLSRVTARRWSGVLYVTAALPWLSLGSPTLFMSALALAALDQAVRKRWRWAGALAGLAAVLDPFGALVVFIVIILALRDPQALRRTLLFALPFMVIALVTAIGVPRMLPTLPLLALLTLAPLLWIAPWGWAAVRDQTFIAALVAWSALDTLTRVIVHQPPSSVLAIGLAALASLISGRSVKFALSVANIVLLIAGIATIPLLTPPTIGLPLSFLSNDLISQPTQFMYSPDLTLIGVAADHNASAGRQVRVRLIWQVGTPPIAPLTIKIDALDGQQKSVASTTDQIAADQWQATMTRTDHMLLMPALPPGVLTLYATVFYQMERIGAYSITRVIVPLGGNADAHNAPPIARFDAGGTLLLEPYTEIQAGQMLIKLRWLSGGMMDRDYKLFVHIEPIAQPAGQNAQPIAAQYDAEPRGGDYPTSLWQPGDVIDDVIPIDLSQVPPGEYSVRFGMYTSDRHVQIQDCAGSSTESLNLATLHITPDRQITVQPTVITCR